MLNPFLSEEPEALAHPDGGGGDRIHRARRRFALLARECFSGCGISADARLEESEREGYFLRFLALRSAAAVGAVDEAVKAELARLGIEAKATAAGAVFPRLPGRSFVRVAPAQSVQSLWRELPEALWRTPEELGALYQEFLAPRKDTVIGALVAPEDVPAATQLFTPPWIADYMVEATLGAWWLALTPESPQRLRMEYYIQPTEVESSENLPSLESITVFDPACGAGRLLMRAYDFLRECYLERCVPPHDAAARLLTRHLAGFDIDPAVAGLAEWCLLIKAFKDSPDIFSAAPRVNIFAAPTRGGAGDSPESQTVRLAGALARVSSGAIGEALARRYDIVLMNPPYMTAKYIHPELKDFLRRSYPGCDKDLFAAFFIRALEYTKPGGFIGVMSPFVWMFISSYAELRRRILTETTIESLIQLEYSGFDGATVPVCTFALRRRTVSEHTGAFIQLTRFRGVENQAPRAREAIRDPECPWRFNVARDAFEAIPGAPIAFWVGPRLQRAFRAGVKLGCIAAPRQGLATTDNARFVRKWWEVPFDTIGFGFIDNESARASGKKWFPYNKGGGYRKWFGNTEHVVLWENDGAEIKSAVVEKYPYLEGNHRWVVKNTDCYFRSGVTWTFVSSSKFGVRLADRGAIFDVAGSTIFPSDGDDFFVLGLLSSVVVFEALRAINPTLNFQAGNLELLPLPATYADDGFRAKVRRVVGAAVDIARREWDSREISWSFKKPRILEGAGLGGDLEQSWAGLAAALTVEQRDLHALEEENNRLFIEAYGVEGEISPEVSLDDVAVGKSSRADEARTVLSYAVGCIVGRYSLDEPGLMYAGSGGEGFDRSRYRSLSPAPDGLVLIDASRDDDIVAYLERILVHLYGRERLDRNLRFLAGGLDEAGGGDAPRNALRSYFARGFILDHDKRYQHRPIYQLFSSGRRGAFRAIGYRHRLSPATPRLVNERFVAPRIAQKKREFDSLERGEGAARRALQADIRELERYSEELRTASM